mmetsp:Transcript_16865/g.28012  ORF Transcript_16865/g.28012 Transcript_16865/m.28012 type:complete len:399 (-) Transcript_16865:218-1414(-)
MWKQAGNSCTSFAGSTAFSSLDDTAELIESREILPARVRAYLPGTFLYLSQGAHEPPRWLIKVARRPDSRAIWGAYSKPYVIPSKLSPSRCHGAIVQPSHCSHANDSLRFVSVYIPNTTWTTGRNALYFAAVREHQRRGTQEQYLIFCDRDADISSERPFHGPMCPNFPTCMPSGLSDPYEYLHELLRNETPAVAAVPMYTLGRNKCSLRACSSDVDGLWAAFHALAAPLLLPYDARLDKVSIFNSQALMIELMDALFPHDIVQYNMFATTRENEHNRRPGYIRTTTSFLQNPRNKGRATDVYVYLHRVMPPAIGARFEPFGFMGRRLKDCAGVSSTGCVLIHSGNGFGDKRSIGTPCPARFTTWQARVPGLKAIFKSTTCSGHMAGHSLMCTDSSTL